MKMVKKSDFWDAEVQKMLIFLDIKKRLWHHLGNSIGNLPAKFQSCGINHTGEILMSAIHSLRISGFTDFDPDIDQSA